MKNIKKIAKDILAASPIKFEELDKEKQEFLTKHGLDKKVQSIFDGIHGYVSSYGKVGTDAMRMDKSDLQKLISDKNFRWLDVGNLGF